MRIIKKGKLPEDKEARFSCYKCKSEIEAKQSEGGYVNNQRDGDFVKFTCPNCGNPTVCVAASEFR